MAGLSGTDWFISSDMFYLEVVLEQTGGVKDVKIHHEGKVEQQVCIKTCNRIFCHQNSAIQIILMYFHVFFFYLQYLHLFVFSELRGACELPVSW